MHFSTLLLVSVSLLLGLTSAVAPGEQHRHYQRQAVTNSSSTVAPPPKTTSSSSSSRSSTLILPSTSISSSSVPISTIGLSNFILAIETSTNTALSKRQAVINGYVSLNGANNLAVAASSANAVIFASAGGQLTTGGLAVFASAASISTPGYAALAVETVAGITTDVTTTFGAASAAAAGGAIVWTNAAFPDGDAVFFVLNGLVYASFSGVIPAGATIVALVPVTPGTIGNGTITSSTTASISVTVSVSVTINVSINIGVGGALVTSTQTVTQTIYQACSTGTGSKGSWTTITYVVPPTSAATTAATVTTTATSLGAGVTTTVVSGGSTVVVAASGGSAGAGAGGATATSTGKGGAVFTGAATPNKKNVGNSLALAGVAGFLAFLL